MGHWPTVTVLFAAAEPLAPTVACGAVVVRVAVAVAAPDTVEVAAVELGAVCSARATFREPELLVVPATACGLVAALACWVCVLVTVVDRVAVAPFEPLGVLGLAVFFWAVRFAVVFVAVAGFCERDDPNSPDALAAPEPCSPRDVPRPPAAEPQSPPA